VKTIEGIIKRINASGTRCCIECRSLDINYFDRVYIQGELYSFPYCNNCGLVQWHVIPGFHLSLEKLYDIYIQMADEFDFSKEKILQDLEHIKKRKGDEGYSDDVVILKEIFERKI
jgi:hypothetical protein